MKRIRRLFYMLFAILLIFSLGACGKDKPKEEEKSGLLKIGDYEVLYKSAKIIEDPDGRDLVLILVDFTNKSESSDSYLWSLTDVAIQNGVELEYAVSFADSQYYDMVTAKQIEEVKAGETTEVGIAYVLEDKTSEIKVIFEEAFGQENDSITIDPSTLSKEEPESSAGLPAMSLQPEKSAPSEAAAETEDALLDWWNGDWYGWWTMSGCYGDYEGMDGQWWDICGTIDIGEDYTGTVILWDEDYTESEPMVAASVSLNTAGTGEHGTMMSEGGSFTDVNLEHADWIVDPGLVNYENMIHIDGFYENGDDEFSYDIFLRPWGIRWDDVEEDSLPYLYDDWYLPMVEEEKSMPDSIGADAPSGNLNTDSLKGTGNTDAAASDSGEAVPGGDGIVTEEQVQKGYVWMSEVAKDIFNTTYEEMVDYFGVEGKFNKEEYSDHMKANYRYYSWISEENKNHFIYVNFKESDPGVYKVSAFNTSGFSGSEALDKYLDIVKAEAADQDRTAAENAVMKEFSEEIYRFGSSDDVKVRVITSIPESGWSYENRALVENDDPTAFGAGAIRFEVRNTVDELYKDSFKNYQEIEDRVIGGITFKGHTYEYIGYDWIQYVAQIDDTRAIAVGLTDLDCFPGTMPDIILNNMRFE